MKTIKYPSQTEWSELIKRPELNKMDLKETIEKILNSVKKGKDKTLFELTERFDKVVLNNLKVTDSEIEKANNLVSDELKKSIQLAKSNIEIFHKSQIEKENIIEPIDGVKCWRKSVGIDKVGL